MVVFPLYTDSSKGKAQKNETVTALSQLKNNKKVLLAIRCKRYFPYICNTEYQGYMAEKI